jgi:hypothetical protein
MDQLINRQRTRARILIVRAVSRVAAVAVSFSVQRWKISFVTQ